MKKLILLLNLLAVSFSGFSQKNDKINFKKDIKPLMEAQQFEKAAPLLNQYYNQNLIKSDLLGEIWHPKAMLLEINSMFLTEITLADLYFNKAAFSGSETYIDSTKMWYNRMIKYHNPDSTYAMNQLIVIQKNENIWKKEGPKRVQELQIKLEKERQQVELLLAEQTRIQNEENEKRELQEKEKLRIEKENQDAILYKADFNAIDKMITSELSKLTNLQLCNNLIDKIEKYQNDQKIKLNLFPGNFENTSENKNNEISFVLAQIPSMQLLLNLRDKLIFGELKFKSTNEDAKVFLLNQYLTENNMVTIQSNEMFCVEKINKRVIDNLDESCTGMIYFIKPFADEENGIWNKIVKLNYSNGQLIKIIYSDGSIYTGETNDVFPNGNGKVELGTDGFIFNIQNDKVSSYEGVFNLGDISEYGILKFKDNSIYNGANNEGFPNGKGKLTSSTGMIQEGEFINGIFQIPFTCKTTLIGNQTWMAENLGVTKFRNGDPIPEALSISDWINYLVSKKPCFAHEDFDQNKGIIYNFYCISDARELAPEGWSIPTLSEWDELGQNIYKLKKLSSYKSELSESLDQDKFEYPIHNYLQSKNGWTNESKFNKNPNGTNDFNFNSVPNTRIFQDENKSIQISEKAWASYWSSTTCSFLNSYGFYGILIHSDYWTGDHTNYGKMNSTEVDSNEGMAVRCIKN